MTNLSRSVMYPEGDTREISHQLRVNQLVDLNGEPLMLPIRSIRTIVYRVWKKTTRAERHCEEVMYHLELVRRPELDGLAREGS